MTQRIRRYSDFDWLRGRLLKEYPNHFIAPLPGKTFINRFGPPEWLEDRRKELDLFIRRLLNNRIFSESTDFRNFLFTQEAVII